MILNLKFNRKSCEISSHVQKHLGNQVRWCFKGNQQEANTFHRPLVLESNQLDSYEHECESEHDSGPGFFPNRTAPVAVARRRPKENDHFGAAVRFATPVWHPGALEMLSYKGKTNRSPWKFKLDPSCWRCLNTFSEDETRSRSTKPAADTSAARLGNLPNDIWCVFG